MAAKEYRVKYLAGSVVVTDAFIYKDNSITIEEQEAATTLPKTQAICNVTDILVKTMRVYGITEIRIKKV